MNDKPKFGILAGEPELIGTRCADGGTCHHLCTEKCSRKTGCVPLTGSGLNDDWSAPGESKPIPPAEMDERAAFEAWYTTKSFEGMAGNDRFERGEDGEYWYIGTRKSWDAWQARAALTASAPTYRAYTTTPGEAVAGIALRQLGDESRWVEIRDLNAHAFPDIGPHDYYPVGTELRLPALSAPSHGELVHGLPECVRAWFEAKKAHVKAVGDYNARLAFVKQHMPFGTSVDPEYQIMEAADRKVRDLVWPMFVGLMEIAAPSPASQEQG